MSTSQVSAVSGLEVEIGAGRLRGIEHPGGAAFLGVPFAAAPVGPRRFAAPECIERWEGVRPADHYGPTPQRRPFGAVTTIPEPSIPGEATLNVNVFTPAAGDRRAGLPVLVWIHGGGFFAGSPASPWYDGRAFARDGVVVVTVAYRLGFDGFGWMQDAPLNRGVLDQIAALEWVQENIAAFGGDPARVTIAGQSAGGASVLTLLSSPRAAGLFAGVISQSGPTSGIPVDTAESVGRAFAERFGIEPTASAWRGVPEDDILDRERDANDLPGALPPTAPVDAVIERLRAGTPSLSLAFSPVADGDSVALDGLAALRGGHASQVPLVAGSTRDEFAFPLPVPLGEIRAALARSGVSEAAQAGYLADVAATGEQFARSRIAVSQLFRAPTLRVAAARAAGGATQTWLYDFAWRSPVTGTSAHCYEIPFTWDVLDAEGVAAQFGDEPPQALADRMHADWVGFITTGEMPWSRAESGGAGAMSYGGETAYDPEAYAFERALIGD
ncbi:carboxylesterase/lipase family protein [Gryllotalpicola koreensis]|uniref:Carboxylic ester hydrolase n=1 Tax=Gryllotalpicola koreensis TaxID=993086 RepID=A0ABP7ZP88_9MICO